MKTHRCFRRFPRLPSWVYNHHGPAAETTGERTCDTCRGLWRVVFPRACGSGSPGRCPYLAFFPSAGRSGQLVVREKETVIVVPGIFASIPIGGQWSRLSAGGRENPRHPSIAER